MTDSDNQELQAPGPKEPLRRIVDSTVAITFARLFMPTAITLLGILMWSAVTDIKTSVVAVQTEMRAANGTIWSAVKDVATKVNTQSTDVSSLKTANEYTTKAVDRLTAVMDQLRKP